MDLAGTASDNNVITQVTWSNNRNVGFVGGSGSATGTTSWNVSYINLEPGENIITVAAIDGTWNTGTDILTVTYNPPPSPSYPIITVTENSTSYLVNINDPDPLTEVSYAWGVRPNIYFIVPFANGSTPALSLAEQARYNYIISNLSSAWDRLSYNKHPVNFYFVEPFVVGAYSSSQNDWFRYISDSVNQFQANYYNIINYPAVYVIIYPDPYFRATYTNIFGSEDKEKLAEVYFADFNDLFVISDEIMINVLLHELTHDFGSLPNDVNFPPGNTKYFWLSHPAGFYRSGGTCDENTSIFDCPSYGASESPTSTEGYYEYNSIISLRRAGFTKAQMGKDPELSPLVEMTFGIRSKYEDANYTYYEGYYDASGFHQIAVHDYGISSRWLYEYDGVERAPELYWDIRFDSPKTQLSNATSSFSLLKSAQLRRSLLVFASDYQNPGYSKVFGANAQSSIVINDTSSPAVPTGLIATAASATQINLSWNQASDNIGIVGYRIYRNGTYIANTSNKYYENTDVSPSVTYSYSVAAYDAAGNIGGQSSFSSATTPSGPPSITFVAPTPSNNTNVTGNYMQANVSLSEAPGICLLNWYNGTWTNVSMTISGLSCYKNMTSLANYTYQFRVYASDSAGNMNLSQMRQNGVEYSLQPCLHEADTNCNRCIEMLELTRYIDRWIINNLDVTMAKMMEAIGLWKSFIC